MPKCRICSHGAEFHCKVYTDEGMFLTTCFKPGCVCKEYSTQPPKKLELVRPK